jgi:DNA replication protein DnaC
MKHQAELQIIFKELGCKLSPESVSTGDSEAILNFLKQESEARKDHRLTRLFLSCGIPKHQIRSLEQLDWDFNSKIPKQEILAFRNSSWIEQAKNLVLIGDPGLGKTHIAKSLCHDAIRKGHSTYFISAFDLISKIKRANNPVNSIEHYGKNIRVLCIDELGYTVHSKEDTDILFQIFSKRSENLPTLLTTNLSPKNWGAIFTGPAASAILDRLSDKGTFLAWEGKSYRVHKSKI